MSRSRISGATCSHGCGRPSTPRNRRLRRNRSGLEVYAGGAALFIACLIAPRGSSAQRLRTDNVPLAYVRTVTVTPPVLDTPADPPLPRRPTADKKEISRWDHQARARAATEAIRSAAVREFSNGIDRVLDDVAGITVARTPGPLPTEVSDSLKRLAHTTARGRANHGNDVSRSFLTLFGRADGLTGLRGSDGCLLTVIDRFGNHTGLEREIWVRVTAWLWKRAEGSEYGRLEGPFFAVGRAVAGRKLLGKGFGRTDDFLLKDAATQAASRLVGTLETGRQPLFMRDCRVAVAPALVPVTVTKADPALETVDLLPSHAVEIASLARQNDVLFQPETSPVATTLDPQNVARELHAAGFSQDEIWTSGRPDRERLRRIADHLRADYIFVSRIRHVDLGDGLDVVADAGQLRPAIRRRADAEVEGALYGAEEDAILWQDRVEGGTVALTEYVRHAARLRTDEQCVNDAARTAYAHLRSSFEDFMRKFDRETMAARRAKVSGSFLEGERPCNVGAIILFSSATSP